ERAIHRGNAVLLQGIKGVGAQTADRLIRELRSKRGSPRSWQVFSRAPGTPLPTEQESGPVAGEGPGEPAIAVADLAAVPAPAPVPVAGADTGFEEARKILMNLQYSDQEATGALRKVAVEQGWDLPAEELVRGALAALQKR
ncbi:MAG: hypothetical protein HYV63_32000, partial [Candidatus Schekmanbacteria bacterium]|nr:hypothetical protein [Candidatus Schekmanbacteria bacterium]